MDLKSVAEMVSKVHKGELKIEEIADSNVRKLVSRMTDNALHVVDPFGTRQPKRRMKPQPIRKAWST